MDEKSPRNFLFIALVGVLLLVSLIFIFMPQKKSEVWSQSVASKKAMTTKVATIPLVAFIGDSYCDGTGASTKLTGWTSIASQELGWFEKNACIGGSGYITSTGRRGFQEAIDGLLTSLKPAIIVISGGKNDLGLMTEGGTEISDASCALFKGIKESLPKAHVVVVSPFWDTTKAPTLLGHEITAIKSCASQYGAKVLPNTHNWFVGNEKLFDLAVGAPNDKGQTFIAEKFVAWYKANGFKA